MIAANVREITRESLQNCGFRESTEGDVFRMVRSFDTGNPECQCELHFLPDKNGWIVELVNRQDDGAVQRVAFPKIFTGMRQVISILALMRGE